MAYKTHKRPEGAPTRGKTAPNRLRRLDTFACKVLPDLLLRRDESVVVDLGYGRVPGTTLELAQRIRRLNPEIEVVGVEIDPERVQAAQAHADRHTRFVRGGFDFTIDEPVRLIRAMNVLRQYPEASVAEAYAHLEDRLRPGGWLIEGTCDPLGRLIVVELHQKGSRRLQRKGLLFSTNFRGGLAPGDFQPVLPKRYIHRVLPGEPIHDFLALWEQCFRSTPPSFGPRFRFAETVRCLRRVASVDSRPWLARRGYLWWAGP